MLFITAKENVIFTSGQLNMWDFHISQTNVLTMLNNQLFQVTY